MKVALPKGTPTPEAPGTGIIRRGDRVFCSENLVQARPSYPATQTLLDRC